MLTALTLARWIKGENIIPESFSVNDISQYDIRYLSEHGNDAESCLSDQVYPLSPNFQTCGSLLYALTGGLNYTSDNNSNVIVLILPGIHPMGERGIEISDYQNIILNKMLHARKSDF